MKTSNEINELAAALSIAQGEFVSVLKTARTRHFKSSFADLASISDVDMARQPLSANGSISSSVPYITTSTSA
jgi:hypothetical protein